MNTETKFHSADSLATTKEKVVAMVTANEKVFPIEEHLHISDYTV